MVDLARLERRARRTAERGRLWMALRVAVAIGPIAIAAIVLVEQTTLCGALIAMLLAASVGLRWWHRRGAEAVRIGLAMGLLPLAVGLVACGCDTGGCEPTLPHAELWCMLAGAGAGIGVAWGSFRAGAGAGQWLRATAIAALTASVGCVGLGASGALLGVAAVVAGGLAMRLPLALRATP